jgi:hypothetical protein
MSEKPDEPTADEPEDYMVSKQWIERLTGHASVQNLVARGVLAQPMVLGPATLRWWHSEVMAAVAQLRRGKGQSKNPRRPSLSPYAGPGADIVPPAPFLLDASGALVEPDPEDLEAVAKVRRRMGERRQAFEARRHRMAQARKLTRLGEMSSATWE